MNEICFISIDCIDLDVMFPFVEIEIIRRMPLYALNTMDVVKIKLIDKSECSRHLFR